jgi:hypothetical protein
MLYWLPCPSFPSFYGKIMSFKYCLALALVPCAVGAQQSNPADANVSVPAASYVSALNNYRSADALTTTPDRTWRAANARVGSEAGGGHAMHAAMPSMSSQQHQPAVEVKVKTGADPHADHLHHAAPAAPVAPTAHSHHEGHQ